MELTILFFSAPSFWGKERPMFSLSLSLPSLLQLGAPRLYKRNGTVLLWGHGTVSLRLWSERARWLTRNVGAGLFYMHCRWVIFLRLYKVGKLYRVSHEPNLCRTLLVCLLFFLPKFEYFSSWVFVVRVSEAAKLQQKGSY